MATEQKTTSWYRVGICYRKYHSWSEDADIAEGDDTYFWITANAEGKDLFDQLSSWKGQFGGDDLLLLAEIKGVSLAEIVRLNSLQFEGMRNFAITKPRKCACDFPGDNDCMPDDIIDELMRMSV